MVQSNRQDMSKSDSIKTSTPALFSTSGLKRRPNTSIFGEPLYETEASTSGAATTSRPQLFKPLSESRPQPYSLPKNRPSFSVAAFGSPLPVSALGFKGHCHWCMKKLDFEIGLCLPWGQVNVLGGILFLGNLNYWSIKGDWLNYHVELTLTF